MEAGGQRLLLAQLAHRQTALEHLARGFTPEEAQSTLHAGGPSATWIFDHLSEMAASTLEALGGQKAEAQKLATLRNSLWPDPLLQYIRIASDLRARAAQLPLEEWSSAPAIEVLPAFRESLKTRAKFLSGHVFHLAYHAGQLASLRSKWGVNDS